MTPSGGASASAAPGRPRGRTQRRSIRPVAGPTGNHSLSPRWWQRAGRLALAATTAFVLVGTAIRLPDGAPLALGAAAVALGAVAVLFTPGRGSLLLWAGMAAAGIAVLGHGGASNVGWFALTVVAFWCALAGTRREAVSFWAGAMLLFAAQWAWVQADAGWGAWMAGTSMAAVVATLLRSQLALLEKLHDAQAELAERARAEERNRIARELHDVIAHSLTVSLLHVASARMAVRFDPAGAARALKEAERLGRESLDEVRATVGLLRVAPDGEGSSGAGGVAPPLPGMSELPGLIEGFRAAGADVTLGVDGDGSTLPPTSGLTVYRIVQEAVTNAVKHAPGAPVSVTVGSTGPTVELTVDSAGRPASGTGSGLLNMRERAESLGGTLTAGPGGRGWLVRASLPAAGSRATGIAP